MRQKIKRILLIQKCFYPLSIGTTDVVEYQKYFNQQISTDIFFLNCFQKKDNYFSANLNNDRTVNGDFLFAIKAINYIIKQRNYYSHVYVINPMTFSFLILFFSKLMGKKTIYDIRTGPIRKRDFQYWLKIVLSRISILFSDKVVLIHSGLTSLYFHNKKSKKIVMSSVGYTPNTESSFSVDLRKKYKIPATSKIFIYIGSLDKKRELTNMIIVFNQHPNADLVILGSGNDTDNLKKISSKNIHFIGVVSQPKVRKYLLQSDFGVSYIPTNSYYKYQPPLKTIEYLGSGLPVIGTNTEGNAQYINQNNGLLTGDSVDSFSQAIDKILQKKYNQISIKKSVEKYSWKNIVNRLLREVV